jgi:hypothetical protein
VEDFILQVHYWAGDIVEEDVSCDSDFMMGVMDRVGKALLAAYKWVKLDEWVHLLMDNAGGHGTDETWETLCGSFISALDLLKQICLTLVLW